MYLKDNEIIEFNPNDYELVEGNPLEFIPENIEIPYNLARDEIVKISKDKIEKIKNKLENKLKKEFHRIKSHTRSQYSEHDEEILKLKEIISVEEDPEKKTDLRMSLQNLENSDDKERAKKDESFFINDERRKHSLDVRHSLYNIAVICYPIFIYHVSIKSKKSSRLIQIKYDPFEKNFSKLFCDSCKAELNELILCGEGHLTCRECGDRCAVCNDIVCKKCTIKKCEKCGKKACKNCLVRCSRCRKLLCKTHGNYKNEKFICNDCTIRCSECGEFIEKAYLKTDLDTGKQICLKCYGKKVSKKALSNIRF